MICVSVNHYVAPEDVKNVRNFLKRHRAPILSKQNGFIRSYSLFKEDGQFLLVTYWETKEQAEIWKTAPDHTGLGPILSSVLTKPIHKDPAEMWEEVDVVLP